MNCTNKQQESCNVEKLGCKGCYYAKNLQEQLDEISMDIARTFGIGKKDVDVAIQKFSTAQQIKNEQKRQELGWKG